MFISEVLNVAVLLVIAWVLWDLSQDFSTDEQDILPVHRPQHLLVYPPPHPAPPSQSYRSSPHTPLLHQHQPVYQPPPHLAPPSQSYRPSPYIPLLHQSEQHRPIYHSPPSVSQGYRSSPYTLPVHQPKQHQPVCQLLPSPSQSHQSSPYTPPIHQLERHQPVSEPPPHRRLPSKESGKSEEQYTPPVHQPKQHQLVYQPRHLQPPPSQSYQPPSPPEPPKREDDTQEDQPNEHYLVLRARANEERDEMRRCLNERRKANRRGDHAAAKDFSKQAKIHKQKMEQLNAEASDQIYLENNCDCRPGEIDLHRLRVKEAIARTDAALEEAKRRGDSEIRIIVGKGLHSEGGEARIRPTIKDLMRRYQLVAEFDPSNSGVLVVKVNGSSPIRHQQHLGNPNRRSRRLRQRASNTGA
ncbi:hypothetical protein EDD18DRAFT_696484 [Armillaria luteobubalina]|uniref:Smr domain-containing protein n=1 Tax=Armillaria luteobubalina TaxID=153913 RepID=A0AA39QGM7_9AGAR|nr:hypothetical protein EDD18DRAFT_696484 [Armillaria luteobubalina]